MWGLKGDGSGKVYGIFPSKVDKIAQINDPWDVTKIVLSWLLNDICFNSLRRVLARSKHIAGVSPGWEFHQPSSIILDGIYNSGIISIISFLLNPGSPPVS